MGFTLLSPEVRVDSREWLRSMDFRLVSTERDLAEWMNTLTPGQEVGADWETNTLNRYIGPLPVGLGLSQRDNEGIYLPIHHTTDAQLNLPEGLIRDILLEFERRGIWTVWWHYLYDASVQLKRWNIDLTYWQDAMIATWIHDPNQKNYQLKSSAKRILGLPMIDYATIVTGRPFQELSPLEAPSYVCSDANATRRIFRKIAADLWFKEQRAVYDQIEKPFTIVLRDEPMRSGVPIHPERVESLSKILGDLNDEEIPTSGLLLDAYNTVREFAGGDINVNSAPQLADLLQRLRVPITERTDGGQLATGKKVLEKYDHPVCNAITRWRSIRALKVNYVDKIQDARRFFESDYLRFPFKQCGAPTGRTACGGEGDADEARVEREYESGHCPINAQSMPKPKKGANADIPDIRECFVGAPPSEPDAADWQVASIDYAQLQMRIAANLSKEPSWIEAFLKGIDFHQKNAEVAGRADNRDIGKTMSFAILFLASAGTVAGQAGISKDEASSIIEVYQAGTPVLQRWVGYCKQHAKQFGFAQTAFGRRRKIDTYFADPRNDSAIAEGERLSVNHPVQGTEADCFKIAAVRVYNYVRQMGYQDRFHQILWVHDELDARIHRSIRDTALPDILRLMEIRRKDWPVPLTVDAGIGDSWGAAKRKENAYGESQ